MQASYMRINVLFEEISINFNILFPLVGNCGLFKNRGNRTGRFTSTAIYTLIGIDVKLFSCLEVFLALSRMNAVNRANVNARGILNTNARLSNYVGHDLTILLLARHKILWRQSAFFRPCS